MSKSLYQRLGGSDGITRIANDLVDIHLANPSIAPRFVNSDAQRLKHQAATFFISGTGGPSVYDGKDMLSAHRGMNISAREFMAVLDDALEALIRNNIGQREQEEVLFVLYGMRNDIMLV